MKNARSDGLMRARGGLPPRPWAVVRIWESVDAWRTNRPVRMTNWGQICQMLKLWHTPPRTAQVTRVRLALES